MLKLTTNTVNHNSTGQIFLYWVHLYRERGRKNIHIMGITLVSPCHISFTNIKVLPPVDIQIQSLETVFAIMYTKRYNLKIRINIQIWMMWSTLIKDSILADHNYMESSVTQVAYCFVHHKSSNDGFNWGYFI